ncbi:hypothetical protein AXG93_4368s1630 [Marchantia polymorpha subsp. ruderalis]|uniref:Retrovirus-related Pol polyprotein from transposon TNT 1-94-like beta-barrel domain-containing protein n=1 Tax=Marchantia polymorpha subsp. ruderalis TaxID=1480154 RepID=A0A176VZ98_MARPO|nr:hypothetical protein AXG93_4368s1630 [Marchantia polymorpha subsp. ruderalis]
MLQASVSLDILSSIAEFEDNPSELWTYLRTLYQSNNAQRRLMFTGKLATPKFRTHVTFEQYLQTIQSLKTQLAAIGHRPSDSDLIHYTLKSLPLSWASFVSNFSSDLSRDPPPDFTNLIAQLQLRASNMRRVKVQANLVDDCNDKVKEGLDSEFVELEALALHESIKYLLDSGANSHVTGNRSTLSSYQPDSSHSGVFTASDTGLPITGKETLRVDSSKEIKPSLYVQGFTKNLLPLYLIPQIQQFDAHSLYQLLRRFDQTDKPHDPINSSSFVGVTEQLASPKL